MIKKEAGFGKFGIGCGERILDFGRSSEKDSCESEDIHRGTTIGTNEEMGIEIE